MNKIRFGIIGAGGIADRRTIPGMLKCDNAELIAVMGPNAERTERLRAKYDAKYAYTSEEALLCNPEVDAVYIASPVDKHLSQAKLAADHGKHILLEKPLALNVEDARELIDYCDARGVRVAAGFMMRFGTCINQMKAAYESGKIGKLISAYAHFTCWYPDIPGSWRQVKASGGGGALMDMGVHMIDLIHYVTGSRTAQVAAMNDTLAFNYEVEDSSNVLLRLENGALCTVQSNFSIPDEAAKWRFELFGTKGRLMGSEIIGQVDGGEVEALYVEDAGSYDAQQDGVKNAQILKLSGEFGDLYQRQIASFCNSLLNDLPFEVDARDGLFAQRVVQAAYDSDIEKRIITL